MSRARNIADTGDNNLDDIVVDGSGNVGIGTSSPSADLDVASSNATIHLTDTDDTTYAEIRNNGGTLSIGSDVGQAAGGSSINFKVDGSERMRIDSSGSVLVGNSTTPSAASANAPALLVSGPNDATIQLSRENATAGGGAIQSAAGAGLVFYTHTGAVGSESYSERMRIDSSGSLRLGTTGTEGVTNRLTVKFAGGGTEYGMVMKPAADNTVPIYFQNASGGNVGSISITASSTSYNTTSDYRLKENVTDISDATTRLKQLNPVRFNFISNPDKVVDGFLAHEVQDVVPEAITGTKDAMRDEEYEVTPAVLDEDGNVVTEAVMGTRSVPDYQGIDQSKLVPLLVKTIQELEARIAALENV